MTTLSVLDVLPVAADSTPTAELQRVGELARLADEAGYARIWYAEHHAMGAIASSAPEVLIAHVAAITRRIRVGSGGVMLPNHAPLRIAEAYRTLAALHPDRIDLGIGRAAGTDPRTAHALRSANSERFPNQLAELLAFTDEPERFADDHPYRAIRAVPDGVPLPPIWMLSSSGASSRFAGQLGLGYAFAQHFSTTPAGPALAEYRRAFVPGRFDKPHAIVAVGVVCAETEAEAQDLAKPMELMRLRLRRGEVDAVPTLAEARAYPWTAAERAAVAPILALQVVGDPDQCATRLHALAEQTGADEIMVATMVGEHEARLHSHRLLAQAMA